MAFQRRRRVAVRVRGHGARVRMDKGVQSGTGCMTRILCVDGDAYLTGMLNYAFGREGFDVLVAPTGYEAMRIVRESRPSLVILDLDTPNTGLQAIHALHALARAPVVVLSTRGRDEDVIAGFDGGADDYVAKPFNMQVFVTRVKAVLRRANLAMQAHAQEQENAAGRIYRIHEAVFDPLLNRIVDGVTYINLTPTQSRILQLLFLHEGQ